MADGGDPGAVLKDGLARGGVDGALESSEPRGRRRARSGSQAAGGGRPVNDTVELKGFRVSVEASLNRLRRDRFKTVFPEEEEVKEKRPERSVNAAGFDELALKSQEKAVHASDTSPMTHAR